MNNTNQTVTLTPRWVANISSLTFAATSVRVVFKDAPVYEGDLEGLKEHVKEHNAHFQDSTVEGRKVGIFYVFKPSNQRQRDWLAGKVGRMFEPGDCYTFATRWAAAQTFKEMDSMGIPSTPQNWPLGIIERQQADENVPV